MDYPRGNSTQRLNGDAASLFPQPPQVAPASRIVGGDGQPLAPQAAKQHNPFLIPHFETFSAIQNAYSRTYRYTYDEALRALPANALAMRRDAMIFALLQERYLPTTQLEWSLVPEDPKNPQQKQVAEELQKILKATPRWQQLMYNLSEAIWYGRAGVQIEWGQDWVGGKRMWKVVNHSPLNGDKIQYSWDGYPCVYINPYFGPSYPADQMVLTDRTMALKINKPELRQQLVIHHYQPDDADYFEGEMAGGVRGVGVRSRIYWSWWLMQQLRAWAMDFMEKVGSLGLLVFYYETGNADSQQAAINAAVQQSNKAVVVWPRPIGQEKQGAGIELLSPTTTGIDALMRMMEDFFYRHIERCIVGQSASASSETSGMGTHNTDFQQMTKYLLLKGDANNAEDTLRNDLVEPARALNRLPTGFPIYWRFSVPKPENKDRMEAAKQLFEMGAALKLEEMYELAELTQPQEGDETIQQQQQVLPGQEGQPIVPGSPPDAIDQEAANDPSKQPDAIDENAAGPGFGEVDEQAASPADAVDEDASTGGDDGLPSGDKVNSPEAPRFTWDEGDVEVTSDDLDQRAASKYAAAFEESKHKRGQPENSGQFGPGGSGKTRGAGNSPTAAGKPTGVIGVMGTGDQASPAKAQTSRVPPAQDYGVRMRSREESNAWAQKSFGAWKASLTPDQVHAISQYADGDVYTPLNNYLRHGNPEGVEIYEAIGQSLDNALNATVPEDTTLWRAVSKGNLGEAFDRGELSPGYEFTDKGYVSTSTSRAYAGNFYGKQGVLMQVRAPAGTRGGYASMVAPDVDDEREFVLPRGSKFRVVSSGIDQKGIRTAVVEVVPQNPARYSLSESDLDAAVERFAKRELARYAKDAHGREHAPAGSSEGGQFTAIDKSAASKESGIHSRPSEGSSTYFEAAEDAIGHVGGIKTVADLRKVKSLLKKAGYKDEKAVSDAIEAWAGGLESGKESSEQAGEALLTSASLGDFAKSAQDIADATPRGFGDNKVFISDAYREASKQDPSLTLDGFKEKLMEANQKGLLELSRADLVESLDPDDVRESQIDHPLGGTFNFIVAAPGSRKQATVNPEVRRKKEAQANQAVRLREQEKGKQSEKRVSDLLGKGGSHPLDGMSREEQMKALQGMSSLAGGMSGTSSGRSAKSGEHAKSFMAVATPNEDAVGKAALSAVAAHGPLTSLTVPQVVAEMQKVEPSLTRTQAQATLYRLNAAGSIRLAPWTLSAEQFKGDPRDVMPISGEWGYYVRPGKTRFAMPRQALARSTGTPVPVDAIDRAVCGK